MATLETGSDPQVDGGGKTDTLLIDTDVHEGMAGGNAALGPYIDSAWRPYVVPHDGPKKAPLLGLHGGLRYASPTNTARGDWQESGRRDAHDVELSKKHLFDEQGVTHAILNGGLRMGSMRVDPDFAGALARAYNDWEIDTWLAADERFLGSIHIVPDQPEESVREIERVADHPRMMQVFMPTVHDRQYGDPFYRPIYEAALRHDLVIAMHHDGGAPTILGHPRYYIEWHTLAAPQVTQGQLNSLIFNGTFDRYPDLKVVLQEGGISWVGWYCGRADQQYREVRNNAPWVKRLPSDHIRSNVRFTTQPITEQTPRQLTAMIEEWRLHSCFTFSTDYPHYDGDSADVLDSLREDIRGAIRYQNALETFPRLRKLGL